MLRLGFRSEADLGALRRAQPHPSRTDAIGGGNKAAAELKGVHMISAPAHDATKHVVEVAQRIVVGYEKLTPDFGLDVTQRDAERVDVLWSGSGASALGLLWHLARKVFSGCENPAAKLGQTRPVRNGDLRLALHANSPVS